MSFRKLRYGGFSSIQFRTRDDREAYLNKHGRWARTHLKFALANARNLELSNYRTPRYWKLVARSFWEPVRVWALNRRALRYYAVIAAVGLGCTYVRGLRPDLFGLAPRQHFVVPDTVRRDFEQLKHDLGMGDRKIRLVISKDYASAEFDCFTDAYVYGSPRLPRGATICLPSVYFQDIAPSSSGGDSAALGGSSERRLIRVGKAAFPWDTVNGVIVRRKLELPRDELRFVMATSLVEANEGMHIWRCVRAPLFYLAGVVTYYSMIWPSLESTRPAFYRNRFRKYELVGTMLMLAWLGWDGYRQYWGNIATCEQQVTTALPALAASGADYLDRVAVVRSIIRNQVGHYATRFINEYGERCFFDWDLIRDTPKTSQLLNRADALRSVAGAAFTPVPISTASGS